MYKQITLTILLSLLCHGIRSQQVLLIDNDAGADDAMAIFLALQFEKYFNGPKIIGLTTSHGNTVEDNVCVNNQRILKVAKRQDVPIYRGSKYSLVVTPDAGAYFGEDGLGDTGEELKDLVYPSGEGAVKTLIELAHTHKENLSIISIGPVTNIALATKLDPHFLGRIKHLYIAAGNIYSKDYPTAEFNAQMDVEAYHIIAQKANPDKVTMLPYSQVKAHLNLTRQWREEVLGSIDTDIIRALNQYERITLPKYDVWQALDPAMVAVIVKPDLVEEYKYSKNGIILCGDQRGINTNEFVTKDDANVRVIDSIKVDEYKQFLLDVFNAENDK